MTKKIKKAVDLYCGAGGTSTGMINAFIKKGYKYWVLGVNHWQVAIDTHKFNHSDQPKPMCDSVENVKPREVVPGGKLDYLWASPECTNHSRAKGGRPKDEQSRATAWDVLKWPQELYIKRIYIENVPEFLEWGPLGSDGNPLKSKKGETFRAFIAVLEALGYTVDYQIMNCADFGAPTSRKRLIIQAVRGRGKIIWPEPTHAKEPGLFNEKPWVPAREIIDFDIKGRSIFNRKKPLAPNTLRRIYHGVVKYWGEAAKIYAPLLRAEIVRSCRHPKRNICPFNYLVNLPKIKDSGSVGEPFMVINKGNSGCKDINSPAPTVTTKDYIGIAESFITRYNKGDDRNHSIDQPLPVIDTSNRFGVVDAFMTLEHGQSNCRDIDSPCPSITSSGAGHIGIAEPFLTKLRRTGTVCDINDPLHTITAGGNHYGLVEPLIVDMSRTAQNHSSKIYPVANPLKTITTRNNMGIAVPLIMGQQSCAVAKPVGDNPVPTVSTAGAVSLIESFILATGHTSGGNRCRSLDEPLSTIVTKAEHCLATPLIVKYNGSEKSLHSVDKPLDTISTKERFGVLEGVIFDIRYRMLQPHELAAAMSFPPEYIFTGKKEDQVKQIGNAVPPILAEALITAAEVA